MPKPAKDFSPKKIDEKTPGKDFTPVKKEQKNYVKMSYRTLVIAAVIIIILAAGIYLAFNIPSGVINSEKVNAGDTVQVTYIGKLENGTIFDTNDPEAARKANIQRPSFEPFEFVIGTGQVIKGFDNAVVGMSIGEKKTVTILPQDAYGQYDPEALEREPRVETVNRTVTFDTVFNISKDIFVQSFGKDPVLNEQLDFQNSKYKVLAIQDNTVRMMTVLTVGQVISNQNAPWNATVTAVTEKNATIRQDPVNGQRIPSEIGYDEVTVTADKITLKRFAEVGAVSRSLFGTLTVKEVTDTEIVYDTNHPLAGKTLIFEITVVNVSKVNATA